jgi:hypothetical protein
VARGAVMAQSFPPAPPRLQPDWTSWVVIAAIVLLLAAFGLYVVG